MNFIPLTVSLDEACIGDFIRRYHFDDKDKKEILRLLRRVSPRVHAEFHYVLEEGCAIVVMTLGKAFDELQEGFLRKGDIHGAYIVDCLGLEFMWAAYDEIDRELTERTGLHPGDYTYVGEKGLPLSELPMLMSKLGQKQVTYNAGFMLIPKKSVVFRAPLFEKKVVKHGRCTNCENVSCDLRRA